MPQNQMPRDWEPPVPAWSADISALEIVGMTSYGAQSADDNEEFLERFAIARQEPGAPDHIEFGCFTDTADLKNDMAICYWRDPDQSARWRAESSLAAWLATDERLSDRAGYWIESLALPLNRFETLFSSETSAGVASLSSRPMTGPIREHGYWGGMRDRIALSDDDPLEDAAGGRLQFSTSRDTSGQRIQISAPQNLCLIHSAQNWADCAEEELSTYLEDVQPVLKEGMKFLSDNGEDTGCISCRYVTEYDQDRNELPRSFGYAYFLSMGHLEAWSKSHPTHLKIFGEFHKMVEKHNFDISLKLWHEVAVIDEGGGMFEYINCHNRTGLLALTP